MPYDRHSYYRALCNLQPEQNRIEFLVRMLVSRDLDAEWLRDENDILAKSLESYILKINTK